MKEFQATVLAKGQIVIPKELRDVLDITVWSTLSCFVRGNALVCKKKMQTALWEQSNKDQIIVGTLPDGKNVALESETFGGILWLLGKQGVGKSVHALNVLFALYGAGKSIVLFDPFGDFLAEIHNYLADASDAHLFVYTVSPESDRKAFKKTVQGYTGQKIIVINTDFQTLGALASVQLAKPLLVDCYRTMIDKSFAVFIDEFSHYFDDSLRATITAHPGVTCILDQSWDYLSVTAVKILCATIHHFAIYQVSGLTAKYLVDEVGIDRSTTELRTCEKYHFYWYTLWNASHASVLLRGSQPSYT